MNSAELERLYLQALDEGTPASIHYADDDETVVFQLEVGNLYLFNEDWREELADLYDGWDVVAEGIRRE